MIAGPRGPIDEFIEEVADMIRDAFASLASWLRRAPIAGSRGAVQGAASVAGHMVWVGRFLLSRDAPGASAEVGALHLDYCASEFPEMYGPLTREEFISALDALEEDRCVKRYRHLSKVYVANVKLAA